MADKSKTHPQRGYSCWAGWRKARTLGQDGITISVLSRSKGVFTFDLTFKPSCNLKLLLLMVMVFCFSPFPDRSAGDQFYTGHPAEW